VSDSVARTVGLTNLPRSTIGDIRRSLVSEKVGTNRGPRSSLALIQIIISCGEGGKVEEASNAKVRSVRRSFLRAP
jgi:hypothetical protein